jgi:hypothetical protein
MAGHDTLHKLRVPATLMSTFACGLAWPCVGALWRRGSYAHVANHGHHCIHVAKRLHECVEPWPACGTCMPLRNLASSVVWRSFLCAHSFVRKAQVQGVARLLTVSFRRNTAEETTTTTAGVIAGTTAIGSLAPLCLHFHARRRSSHRVCACSQGSHVFPTSLRRQKSHSCGTLSERERERPRSPARDERRDDRRERSRKLPACVPTQICV